MRRPRRDLIESKMVDRQKQIQMFLDHYDTPRHWGTLADADVVMPGGNSGCGDIVTIYLKGSEDHDDITGVSFVAEGCTISVAASSMILEQIVQGGLTMNKVLELDYNEMLNHLGRPIVSSRAKCATLGLGTLKAAIRRYQKDKLLADSGVPPRESTVTTTGGLVFGEGATEAARKVTVSRANNLDESLLLQGSVRIVFNRLKEG